MSIFELFGICFSVLLSVRMQTVCLISVLIFTTSVKPENHVWTQVSESSSQMNNKVLDGSEDHLHSGRKLHTVVFVLHMY